MPLDQLLIEVLACPIDKGPLLWFETEDVLYNPRLHKSYAVRDGVPVMLVDEATDVGEAEHDRLMAKAATGGAIETGTRGSGGAARPAGSGGADSADRATGRQDA
jgi:uncharacterized protein YbaR (Trm112 family)